MLTSFSANVREACATSEQYDNEKNQLNKPHTRKTRCN